MNPSAMTLEDMERETVVMLELHQVLPLYACQAQTAAGKAQLLQPAILAPDQLAERHRVLTHWAQRVAANLVLAFPPLLEPASFATDATEHPFTAEELRMLRDFLRFLCREEECGLSFLPDRPQLNEEHRQLAASLDRLFEPSGAWSPQASPQLGMLLHRLDLLHAQTRNQLTSLLQRHAEILSEPIIFERNGRCCLAVRGDFKGRIRGIAHDFSASGKTVFLEPDVCVGPQNEIAGLQSEIGEEILRIRRELSRLARKNSLQLGEFIRRCAGWDACQALALAAMETDSTFILPSGRDLHLLQARHPILDRAFARLRRQVHASSAEDHRHMVPISIRLDEETRGILLSGSNTGGKTVTLKTLGLIASLARFGFPLPCREGSTLPHYSQILADIGDHQSMAASLSTFASHLAYLRAALDAPAGKALFLLDELGGGTDPVEGAAIARAVLEELLRRQDHFLVTTHMQSLCAFALSQPGLVNASMAFDPVLLQPNYHFRQGLPGRSHALEIASQSGLQADLLERSRVLLGGQHLELSSIIASLQERFAELEKERAELKRQQRRLQRKTAAAAEEERTLAAVRKDVQNQTRTKVRAEVERAETRLRDLLQGVRSRHLRQEVAAELAAVKAELLPETAPEVVQLDAPASGLPPQAWNKGDLVLHLALRKTGTLLRVDRKTVQIDLGGLHLLARCDEVLHLAAQASTQPAQVSSEGPEQAPPALLQLRLLGLSVDQALAELESCLDRALALEQPFLEIVHGKGSGALKSAVRQHLASHPASSWWSVELDPQNDGITRLIFQ